MKIQGIKIVAGMMLAAGTLGSASAFASPGVAITVAGRNNAHTTTLSADALKSDLSSLRDHAGDGKLVQYVKSHDNSTDNPRDNRITAALGNLSSSARNAADYVKAHDNRSDNNLPMLNQLRVNR